MRQRFGRNAFCEKCNQRQAYHLAFDDEEMDMDGVHVRWVEERAVCDICGNEIYIQEVNDRNADRRFRAYRDAKASKLSGQLKENAELLRRGVTCPGQIYAMTEAAKFLEDLMCGRIGIEVVDSMKENPIGTFWYERTIKFKRKEETK